MPETAQIDEAVDLNLRIREKAMFQIELLAQGQWVVVGHGTTRTLAEEEMSRKQVQNPGFKFRVRPVRDDSAVPPAMGDHGEIGETSVGARTLGLKMARDRGMVQNKEEVDKLLAAMHENQSRLSETDTALEEAAEKLSRAELRKMDIKRAKREKRGRGRATSKQRSAARKNAKKATRSMGKALTQRKKARTAKPRARLRGTTE